MSETILETCLHSRHLALGAKMSPFAGYDMPIQYSGIADEHNAVRHECGVFDVSHMGEIFVSGADAAAFVNHIFTGDAASLECGKILYGMLLYPDGGVVDDLLVYRLAPESFLLVVNAANIAKDDEWIRSQKGKYGVIIDNQSEKWGQIALQGPRSEEVLGRVLGIDGSSLGFYSFMVKDGVIVSRTGYTGEDGFEVYAAPEAICRMWDALIESGVAPCGLGCRDTLRFEAGLPLYGHELSAGISPVMAGLSMFCNLEKAEFIGREAIVAQKAGATVRKLVGLEVHDRAIPRSGYAVELPDGTPAGEVTTGYRSISLDKSICFALVDKAVSALGTELQVRIRNKVFPATVVKKRFYQTNYKK